MFGLAAIAAVTAMAIIGAGSASATVLCKENASPCKSVYGAGEIIEGTALNAKLTSDLANVKCAHSETTSEIENPGGAGKAVTGKILSLNFTGCETEQAVPVKCTVSVNNIPYHTEVTGSGGNGTLKVKSGGSGNPGATVVCIGVINCTFSRSLFELPITGGNPAAITANKVTLERTGGLCGKEAFWDATYKAVGTNTAIWVVSE
jgi:hypothetical protein